MLPNSLSRSTDPASFTTSKFICSRRTRIKLKLCTVRSWASSIEHVSQLAFVIKRQKKIVVRLNACRATLLKARRCRGLKAVRADVESGAAKPNKKPILPTQADDAKKHQPSDNNALALGTDAPLRLHERDRDIFAALGINKTWGTSAQKVKNSVDAHAAVYAGLAKADREVEAWFLDIQRDIIIYVEIEMLRRKIRRLAALQPVLPTQLSEPAPIHPKLLSFRSKSLSRHKLPMSKLCAEIHCYPWRKASIFEHMMAECVLDSRVGTRKVRHAEKRQRCEDPSYRPARVHSPLSASCTKDGFDEEREEEDSGHDDDALDRAMALYFARGGRKIDVSYR